MPVRRLHRLAGPRRRSPCALLRLASRFIMAAPVRLHIRHAELLARKLRILCALPPPPWPHRVRTPLAVPLVWQSRSRHTWPPRSHVHGEWSPHSSPSFTPRHHLRHRWHCASLPPKRSGPLRLPAEPPRRRRSRRRKPRPSPRHRLRHRPPRPAPLPRRRLDHGCWRRHRRCRYP